MRQVIFLDYDGVLHRGDTYVTPNGVVSSAPGIIELFEFASVLLEMLAPYPKIELVLSTDWCFKFGFARARDALPLDGLRMRVTGATYEPECEDVAAWQDRQRGLQIAGFARRHKIADWLAVDDRRDGFHDYFDRLVHCQTDVGLGDRAVVEVLRSRLAERFSEAPLF
ncbi:HAD domain-containing protein [Paraburkholderia sp. GAS334]|uniref:HAD domain-containing protein n=1 Tax=Paraburkholderia sp. GAS334 TaxID=3035131 RepID=UPI003D239244